MAGILWFFPVGSPTRHDDICAFGDTALPAFVTEAARAKEEIEAQCEMISLGLSMVEAWTRQTYRLFAEGRWLDEIGADRGVFRRGGETDDGYRERVSTVSDAVTPAAIKNGVVAVITAAGGSLSPFPGFVELQCDCAFLGDNSVNGAVSIQSYIGDGSTSDGNTNGDAMTNQQGILNPFIVLVAPSISAVLLAAIDDFVRQRRAFGIAHRVERYV